MELIECLGGWERFLHDDALPPLHAALAHSQFEAIHPFLDGNGRAGRLLIMQLLQPGRPPLSPALMEAGPAPGVSPRSWKGPLDLFAENPFWTVGGLADRLSVAFTTAQRAIDRLEAAGVVAQVGEGRRNRVCCAGAILDVLEEPPVLS